jgi:hypothetical protein
MVHFHDGDELVVVFGDGDLLCLGCFDFVDVFVVDIVVEDVEAKVVQCLGIRKGVVFLESEK